MNLDSLISSLRARIPWHVMRELIRYHNLDNGQGWEKTIPKWELYASQSLEKKEKLFSVLSGIYYQQVLSGEKTTKLFSIPSTPLTQLCNHIKSDGISENQFSEKFPLPLEGEDLEKANRNLELCELTEDSSSGSVTLIFCSIRTINERVTIDIEDYIDSLPEDLDLGSYSEIVGLKSHTKQFFDVVIVDPDTGTLEVRLDSGSGLTHDHKGLAFMKLEKTLNELFTVSTGAPFTLPLPVNFFPVINELYHSKEGRVCELAFTTEGGSIKHEKMRRKHTCLREEAYHQGGSKAVDGQIAPYRIAATWERRLCSHSKVQPELMLPGHARMLQSTTSSLDEVVISNCGSSDDYSFIMKKLAGLMPKSENDA